MNAKPIKSFREERQNLFNKLNTPNRQIAFLFGAGTSVPANLPDMNQLTKAVEEKFKKTEWEKIFQELLGQLNKDEHIENILSFLEEVSQLSAFSKILYKDGKAPCDWDKLTIEIKKSIAEVIEQASDLSSEAHQFFAKWLLTRRSDTEIYTINYDLVLEAAFENHSVFYFDGFVGGIAPKFHPATIDPVMASVAQEVRPPSTWIRLWKMHGSINWEAKKLDGKLIVRRNQRKSDHCLIYPSATKYTDSRRLPFIVLQDKFRRTLFTSNMTVVILGYSFGDEHLNEIILDTLDKNKNIDMNVLSFKNISDNHILRESNGSRLTNLTIFSPDQFFYQGAEFSWDEKERCNLGDAKTFFKDLECSVRNGNE